MRDWILIDEELPQYSGEYLVKIINNDYKSVGIAWVAHYKYYDAQKSKWKEQMDDEKIIAWMPKPYKLQKGEE